MKSLNCGCSRYYFFGVFFLILTACQSVGPDASLPSTAVELSNTPEKVEPFPSTEESTLESSIEISSDPIVPIPHYADYQWQIVAEGFEQPTVLAHAGDGSGRLFIAEKKGRVQIIENGFVNIGPFLDISEKVFTGENAGLLGLVFDPNFVTNGFFYLYYVNAQRNTVVSRFSVSQENAGEYDPLSEYVILEIDEGQAGHYAGTLAFGPDNNLYIAVGDGGLDNAGLNNNPAQDVNSLRGKILRIDVGADLPYLIPEGNVFVNANGRDEIWALGLRNPWGFSFDFETGEVFVADPGHNSVEELNYLPTVDYWRYNFSWNYLEGSKEFQASLPSGNIYVSPVFEYEHINDWCSVIGGTVYRGTMPEWQGIYIFGDYCQGDIWAFVRNFDDSWTIESLARLGEPITAFGADESGEIYVLSLSGVVRVLAPYP